MEYRQKGIRSKERQENDGSQISDVLVLIEIVIYGIAVSPIDQIDRIKQDDRFRDWKDFRPG